METLFTFRNTHLKANNNIELLDLRAGKWRSYQTDEVQEIQLGEQSVRFRSGLTFTPFANPTPCNAHCRFCSEELRRKHQQHLTAKDLILDYDRYFAALKTALIDLSPLHSIGLSLSGLEATSEPRWLLRLLELLSDDSGLPDFDEKVLYTNGSGLVNHPDLIDALRLAGFDRIELSRCHYDEEVNQRIMYFNRNQPVYRNAAYEKLLQNFPTKPLLKNSCILTEAGINNLEQIERYLDWAIGLGVQKVVFRELSRLNEEYENNSTKRWTDDNRVPIDPLLMIICPALDQLRSHWTYDHSVQGYYYYNEHFHYRNQIEVIMETSSYDALMNANEQDVVQKLVFHSNGNLCGDWDPDSKVIKNYFHD